MQLHILVIDFLKKIENLFFLNLHVLYTEIFTLKAYNSAKKQQMRIKGPGMYYRLMENQRLKILCYCPFKGTGTRDLIWLKAATLDRSWWVGFTNDLSKLFSKGCFIFIFFKLSGTGKKHAYCKCE